AMQSRPYRRRIIHLTVLRACTQKGMPEHPARIPMRGSTGAAPIGTEGRRPGTSWWATNRLDGFRPGRECIWVPQDYFGEDVAAFYDEDSKAMFAPSVLGPAVDLLAELAGGGAALEFAIGTGRVAPWPRRPRHTGIWDRAVQGPGRPAPGQNRLRTH